MGAMRTPPAAQGQGDVVGQVGDLGELHALVQGELIPGDAGSVDHVAGAVASTPKLADGLRQAAGSCSAAPPRPRYKLLAGVLVQQRDRRDTDTPPPAPPAPPRWPVPPPGHAAPPPGRQPAPWRDFFSGTGSWAGAWAGCLHRLCRRLLHRGRFRLRRRGLRPQHLVRSHHARRPCGAKKPFPFLPGQRLLRRLRPPVCRLFPGGRSVIQRHVHRRTLPPGTLRPRRALRLRLGLVGTRSAGPAAPGSRGDIRRAANNSRRQKQQQHNDGHHRAHQPLHACGQPSGHRSAAFQQQARRLHRLFIMGPTPGTCLPLMQRQHAGSAPQQHRRSPGRRRSAGATGRPRWASRYHPRQEPEPGPPANSHTPISPFSSIPQQVQNDGRPPGSS